MQQLSGLSDVPGRAYCGPLVFACGDARPMNDGPAAQTGSRSRAATGRAAAQSRARSRNGAPVPGACRRNAGCGEALRWIEDPDYRDGLEKRSAVAGALLNRRPTSADFWQTQTTPTPNRR